MNKIKQEYKGSDNFGDIVLKNMRNILDLYSKMPDKSKINEAIIKNVYSIKKNTERIIKLENTTHPLIWLSPDKTQKIIFSFDDDTGDKSGAMISMLSSNAILFNIKFLRNGRVYFGISIGDNPELNIDRWRFKKDIFVGFEKIDQSTYKFTAEDLGKKVKIIDDNGNLSGGVINFISLGGIVNLSLGSYINSTNDPSVGSIEIYSWTNDQKVYPDLGKYVSKLVSYFEVKPMVYTRKHVEITHFEIER